MVNCVEMYKLEHLHLKPHTRTCVLSILSLGSVSLREREMGKDDSNNLPPLFETKAARGRIGYLLYLISMMVGLCLIIVYRFIHLPPKGTVGRWAWIGLLVTELCFSLYWIITQSVRWNPSYRYTFKQRLSQRSLSNLILIFLCSTSI